MTDPNIPSYGDDENEGGGTGKKILIAFLVILLLGSVGLYVSDISLKNLWSKVVPQGGEKVGTVKTVNQQLKRQPKDSLEFLDAKEGADLFNEDTIMTGPSDHAVVELFDGSFLELEPGSLIRLSFETANTVSGIERRVFVDIVAGNVKGNEIKPQVVVRKSGRPVPLKSILPSTLLPPSTSAPQPIATTAVETPAQPTPPFVASPEPLATTAAETPSPEVFSEPSPEPSLVAEEPVPAPVVESIRITQPQAGQVFSLTPGLLPPLKQALIFDVKGNPDAEVTMLLRNDTGKEVLRKTVKANSGRGGLLASFASPGNYRVEVLAADGTKIGKGIQTKFSVAGEFPGLEILPPLVGGEAIDSNQFTGKKLKDFDVVLRWNSVDGVSKYRLLVKNNAGKTLVDEVVSDTKYAFPKGKIYSEPLSYTVRAEYPSGYAAVSKSEQFLFNFTSPQQTLPKNDETLSLASAEIKSQHGILFSWQRTTFTQAYEFEIASDADFQKILKQVGVKQQDNFLIFRNLKPAEYWWRVRAVNAEMKSPPRAGFKITVTP